MNTKPEHTPVPWTIEHACELYDANSRPVLEIADGNDFTNTQRFEQLERVRVAVNAHDALVDAAEKLDKWDADYSDTADTSDNLNWDRFDEIMREFRAALRLAKGGAT